MSIEELKKLHYEGSKKLTNMPLSLAWGTPYHDIQEKIFSDKMRDGGFGYFSRLLNGLASNPKISPKLQIPILNATRNTTTHSYMAENPNIHPDTIKHLIDHHHKCDDVRHGIEQNKSLSRKQKHDIIDSMLEKNEDYL